MSKRFKIGSHPSPQLLDLSGADRVQRRPLKSSHLVNVFGTITVSLSNAKDPELLLDLAAEGDTTEDETNDSER